MPHVVIEGAGDLQVLYQAFAPLIQRAGNDILKVREFYLARSGKEALLESITIEQGAVCNYFVQLKLHETAINQDSRQSLLNCGPTCAMCSLPWPTMSSARRPWKSRWRS